MTHTGITFTSSRTGHTETSYMARPFVLVGEGQERHFASLVAAKAARSGNGRIFFETSAGIGTLV